jgi:hypothetical protein
MQLETIIAALRLRCPVFANRVAGAAQFKSLQEATAMPAPCAYVIPLDDEPGESRSQNAIRMPLTDSFAVVVALGNTPDEKGQSSVSSIHTIRAALWSALLGWEPEERYGGIEYQGGQLLSLDRAHLWYQFEFGAAMEIEDADGWQGPANAALPHFDGATLKLDAIDVADPNVQNPGPDGRIEIGAEIADLPE